MKFYNRDRELSDLNKIHRQTADSARMTVITGRRRVGKTFTDIMAAVTGLEAEIMRL